MSESSQPPLVVFIVGPTGTGKTEAGVSAALAHSGEVVSADSMQFYTGMDLGTAKPSLEQRQGVPHHLIDRIDPDHPYNVSDFHADATKIIEQITERGNLPLVVGGSGLYVRALANKLDLPVAEPDDELRDKLKAFAKHSGPLALHARLTKIDPASAERIHPNDQKKIIRAIEVYERTGRPLSEIYSQDPEPTDDYDCLMFGLTCDREELYRRVEERCDHMINSGLIKEVQLLLDKGYSTDLQAMQAIGYKELAAFLKSEVSFPEAVETFKRNTRRYVKRQLTWFKTDSRIQWIDIMQQEPSATISEAIADRQGAARNQAPS